MRNIYISMRKFVGFSMAKDFLMYLFLAFLSLIYPQSRSIHSSVQSLLLFPALFAPFTYSLHAFLSVNTNIQVRNKNEQWVRCALQKGDFLILPAGIYHRFTPAQSDFVHAMRLFKDEPKWTAYPRKD